jgi:hypothetical protein
MLPADGTSDKVFSNYVEIRLLAPNIFEDLMMEKELLWKAVAAQTSYDEGDSNILGS